MREWQTWPWDVSPLATTQKLADNFQVSETLGTLSWDAVLCIENFEQM